MNGLRSRGMAAMSCRASYDDDDADDGRKWFTRVSVAQQNGLAIWSQECVNVKDDT
mgnify:CR=1 FL=1